MTMADFEREVAMMIDEDDYALWEVLWTANSQLPELTPDQRLQESRRVVRDLLEGDLVYLFERRWSARKGAPERPLRKEEALAALQELHWWDPDTLDGREPIWMWSTDKGREAYRAGLLPSVRKTE